ncbi:MAG: sigma-70 family RNA polymerase sigma factor [Planctomycetota bacterium]|nr:sigma-70 family RNA polymerase sigma factor [Planctomycetota bacterium]
MSHEVERVYDALLIARYQAEDDSSLDELVQRYQSRVRGGVVHWLGGDVAAVDDVCQQVWLGVVKGLKRLNQPMAFEGWLQQIVRAQVALFLRSSQRLPVPLDAVFDPEDRSATIPQEVVDWDKLDTAVNGLGEPYTSMLRMRFWQSYSYQQIAETLNIPIGTVRSRLHWAREKLAKQLCLEEL